MRQWHRFIAPYFAAFLLIIAFTGLATQATDLLDTRPAASAQQNSSGSAAARGGEGRRAPSPMKQWNHWFKKLHSGELLGPVGIAFNIASGAALLFFAGSGLWMYVSMAMRRYRRR